MTLYHKLWYSRVTIAVFLSTQVQIGELMTLYHNNIQGSLLIFIVHDTHTYSAVIALLFPISLHLDPV